MNAITHVHNVILKQMLLLKVPVFATLRMFVRKSSNIDFFIKLLLQLGYELLLSEMQKIWGVTDFVLEIRYLKGHPNIEKSVFLTRYGSNVCVSKILQMNL